MILFYNNNYDSFDCYIESLLETETSLCLYVFTQLSITTNYARVQVNTGASEDGRLVRARDWRRSANASPRLFRKSTCCGERCSGVRHRQPTKQPGPVE